MRYLAIVLLVACGSSRPSTTPVPAREVAYYEGTTTTTSPDGATPYGPAVAVIVRRTIDPAAKTIEEYVVNQGEEHPATMTQRDGAVFAVVDPKGEYEGTITFAGPAWHFTSWSYEIKLAGKGTLTGRGEVSPAGLKTDKQFLDPTGTPRARIRDVLHVIDESTFQRRLGELLPANERADEDCIEKDHVDIRIAGVNTRMGILECATDPSLDGGPGKYTAQLEYGDEQKRQTIEAYSTTDDNEITFDFAGVLRAPNGETAVVVWKGGDTTPHVFSVWAFDGVWRQVYSTSARDTRAVVDGLSDEVDAIEVCSLTGDACEGNWVRKELRWDGHRVSVR